MFSQEKCNYINFFLPFRDRVFEKNSLRAFGAKGSCVAITRKIFSALRAEKRKRVGIIIDLPQMVHARLRGVNQLQEENDVLDDDIKRLEAEIDEAKAELQALIAAPYNLH